MPDYSKNLSYAEKCKQNVEKKYALGVSPNWGYYFAKEVLKHNTNTKQITIKGVTSEGDHISRQIYKSSYIDLAERFVKYVEKKFKLPASLEFVTLSKKKYNIALDDLVYMFARIIVFYKENKAYPKYENVNSKAFVKPTEYPNEVFEKWVKTFKFTPKCLDDVCDYILRYFTYLFYYDDQKSNAEVISSKSGNCTDLLQLLVNMAKALGYEAKVIHTQCKQSGVGHVYGMFRKKGVNNGNWFVRDIACIADESRYCVWCEVPNGGYKLAENPSWFMQNLNR